VASSTSARVRQGTFLLISSVLDAAVWRSVRSHGDVNTEKSRRTLALPLMAVNALKAHREREPQTSGLVFAATANVRREFRAVCKRAGISGTWTPRELRHSFVSLMSSTGAPVEEIARLAGHSSSRTTEVVYRRELRPVLTTGAETMDRIFARRQA
jgi:integrase